MITEPVKISQSDIRRLLSAANPDAALLYLYINGGNRPEDAEADLHFSAPRYGCAAATLRQLGLWPEDRPSHIAPGERPSYCEKDVLDAMDSDNTFRSLYGEVQRLLGRSLNTEELKILLGFVRYLGLTADVISLLVCYWNAPVKGGTFATRRFAPSRRKPTTGRSGASTPWRKPPPSFRRRTCAIPGCPG